MNTGQGKTALIIVDVQKDFCEGGSLQVNNASEIIPIINNLRKNPKFDHLVYTKDYHPQDHISFASNHPGKEPFTNLELENGKIQELWPDHCVIDKKGQEFHKDLDFDINKDILIHKGTNKNIDSYSGFGAQGDDSGLCQKLKDLQVKKIVVVGLAYDFCVGCTALDGPKYGFDTYLLRSATKSVAENFEKIMDEKIKNSEVKLVQSVKELEKVL
ncbi:Isochorismatase-like protein [Pseudocohnilembus persalinus]|uniref:nicotinamidase n=1 Tax=Pseudocohnilembus persalinus TaxID=266149 RepID=A0A0V0QHU1_PSEPJ|nr:Isochorismatase-like protein [Pseudocohnilembus persalinus]|eukprot:KRX01616.1 Isochorismatase-like protein [Pseudocohnilembus persalinus]